jgi:hypothetical protein
VRDYLRCPCPRPLGGGALPFACRFFLLHELRLRLSRGADTNIDIIMPEMSTRESCSQDRQTRGHLSGKVSLHESREVWAVPTSV